MGTTYEEFLLRKSQIGGDAGFDPVFMPEFLFDFQKMLITWALRKGRAAIFADCGMGKTPIELVYAENVVRKTNGRVLILAPLAVSQQIVREGEKFGIEVKRSRDGKPAARITVTNYERVHLFESSDYTCVICDESSALKQFDGQRRKDVTRFMSKAPYRLLSTATAAPNDYVEMGTSSEALGVMGQMDMLHQFFKSTDDLSHVFFRQGDWWNTHKWMFRPHAETQFWRWVCSWARAIRKPSDFGFDDGPFILPPLEVNQHIVNVADAFPGELFPRIAQTLKEQRIERKLTMTERCEKVAELTADSDRALVWCHLNVEGDALEESIPDAVQVAGANSDDEKEERLLAFANSEIRVLVTKPKIGAFGLNLQNCAHMTFFPSHSYEQYYQGVRRCWRFGQKRPVRVDIITTPGEAGVTANLQRKSDAASKMFDMLLQEMNNALAVRVDLFGTIKPEVPSWLAVQQIA